MDKPKLNYGKTFHWLGFFGISVMWKLYNDYVPIFLQAGNPTLRLYYGFWIWSRRYTYRCGDDPGQHCRTSPTATDWRME